jgi:hypothetical protein
LIYGDETAADLAVERDELAVAELRVGLALFALNKMDWLAFRDGTTGDPTVLAVAVSRLERAEDWLAEMRERCGQIERLLRERDRRARAAGGGAFRGDSLEDVGR